MWLMLFGTCTSWCTTWTACSHQLCCCRRRCWTTLCRRHYRSIPPEPISCRRISLVLETMTCSSVVYCCVWISLPVEIMHDTYCCCWCFFCAVCVPGLQCWLVYYLITLLIHYAYSADIGVQPNLVFVFSTRSRIYRIFSVWNSVVFNFHFWLIITTWSPLAVIIHQTKCCIV